MLVPKGNQPQLLADVQETVRQALEGELPARVVHQSRTSESGHGRPYSYQPPYQAAQQEATAAGRGLWAGNTCAGR